MKKSGFRLTVLIVLVSVGNMKDNERPAPHPLCAAKHTRYQPTEEEFCCPKCAAPGGDFHIDEMDPDAHEECEALHVKDCLICSGKNGKGCDWTGASAQAFANKIARAQNMVKCPTCKGHGMVKRLSAV